MATERDGSAVLREDRRDLLEVVRMRFGEPESDLLERVEGLSDAGVVQHLILVAANEPYPRLLRELGLGAQSL